MADETLSERLKRICVLIGAVLVMFGGVFVLNQREARISLAIERAHGDAATQMREISTAVGAMETGKNDFLLARRMSLLDSYDYQYSVARAAMEELGEIPTASDFTPLFAQLDAYIRSSREELSLRITLGLTERKGYEGALRSIAHRIEDRLETLGEPELTLHLLMMRRHEKDFMMRLSPDYRQKLNQQVTLFQNGLGGSGLTAADQNKLAELSQQYRTAFDRFAEARLRMDGLDRQNEASFQQLTFALGHHTASLDALAGAAVEARREASSNAQRFLLLGGFVLILSVVGVAVMLRTDREFADLIAQREKLAEQSARLEALNAANEQLAMADPLTRLPNRRHFFDALEKTLERHRNAETRFAVGLLDLDGFKLINDLYGHGVGDELLIKTGQRLQEVLAGTVEIARLGGDEFGLIFDDASDPELVMAIAQEICGAMALPFTLSTGRAKVAATLGIAIYPEAAGDAQKLFERADYALYYSKQNSKGAPVLFSEMHRAIIREVASIEQRLYEADLEREMTVFFQPIVEMETGRVIAMEALARWNSPTLGNVAPDSFIRSAEQTGTINHVTRLLIRKALEAAESWPEHVALSFNLSAQDLTEHATLQLAAIIEASEFAPSRLMLEITETAMLRDLETATQALEPLRLLGCKVALDDFGTGYSSLSYLHKMPIDHVKIDRSFVRALGENESATDLLSALHALCSQLKLGCVIEGLETADHVEALMACGYSLAQGFHFARPMRATHAARFLDPARCADAA